MAGVSEMPYRRIARRMGAGAAPTELVSAKGLLYGQERTKRYLRHTSDEAPFWVQLFGGDPAVLATASRKAVDLGADILDLNMGCPVRKVTKTGAGSALLADPLRAHQVVAAMAQAGVPVTVKIRSGWDADHVNALEVIRAVADAGAVSVAVHARTRQQGYSGKADWGLLRRLVEASPVPIIGNGDAFSASLARRMREETGCAAVMIGRGALGNPWIFAQLSDNAAAPSAAQRWQAIEEHFAAHAEHTGDALRAVRKFRQHLGWYSTGLRDARRFRQHVYAFDDAPGMLSAAKTYFLSAAPLEAGLRGQDQEFATKAALG